jgi:hypothetical protein
VKGDLKMTERMKKMLYNLYKGIANQTVDSNDQLYYIELLKANSEFVDEVLNSEWHISNSLNYKNTFKINFEFANDGIVRAYVIDGNLNRRYIDIINHKWINNQKYIAVPFPQNSAEQNAIIAKAEMKKLMEGVNRDLASIKATKEMLIDETEKCYAIRANSMKILIPKSLVGFDGENVVVAQWWVKKNKTVLQLMELI